MKILFESYLNNFKILRDEEIKILVDNADIRLFKKKSHISTANNCYLVLVGCVREYFIKEGIEKTIAFYTEGESIVFVDSPNNLNSFQRKYQCVEDSILTVSDDEIEKEMCALIPRLQTIILDEVQAMLNNEKNELVDFKSSNPEERYINLINNKPSLLQRVPQHQIASYLGITPESLSRLKKRMKVNK